MNWPASTWTWQQTYNPTGSVIISTLVAAAPLAVLLGLLAIRGWSAPRAAGAGLLTALVIAIFIYRMPPAGAVAAAIMGALFGLFPIGWIVLSAVFLYALTVRSGAFDVVKHSITSLSPDRRIQAILVAFSFGAFLEGAAGFGTPVAITSALMIGAGFPPLQAAGLALIANTAPVAFGALGTPITTLARVTELDELKLSAMAGRQLPFFSIIIPAWMIWTLAGWRGLRGIWPAALVSGGSFAIVQYYVSNTMGPTLVDVAGGVISILALWGLLKVWKPAESWRFSSDTAFDETTGDSPVLCAHQLIAAWLPWVLLSICVVVWGLPSVRSVLEGAAPPAASGVSSTEGALASWLAPRYEFPQLHGRVSRDVSVVHGVAKPEEAILRFNWLSTTGTAIFLAALASAACFRVRPRDIVATFTETLFALRWPLVTIAAMLSIAFTTRYSGIDITLGLAFTRTGVLYPFFAPLLGWLGVALTGSDTSSNALFGSLQRFTAEQLSLNPILICAANSTGGVMGKMIDAQSIVVSAAATGQPGKEGEILRFVFWHSLVLAFLVGVLTLCQAYLTPGLLPSP